MKDKIIDAVGKIDDDMIEDVDALRQRKQKKTVWVRWAAMAACLCIVVTGTVAVLRWHPWRNYDTMDTGTGKPIRGGDPRLNEEPEDEKVRDEEPADEKEYVGADAIPMIYVRDTLYVEAYDYDRAIYEEKREEFEFLGIITENIIEDPAYPDHVPTKDFQTNEMLVNCEVYGYGENIVVYVEGIGYILHVPYGGTDTELWMGALYEDAFPIPMDENSYPEFGSLFPTEFEEGYILDKSGVAVYNGSVLDARLLYPAGDDTILVRVAREEYFGEVEYGVVQYGDEKSDGSRSSMIYYGNEGFTILYQFGKTDIAAMEGEEAERFYAMTHSARCFQNAGKE